MTIEVVAVTPETVTIAWESQHGQHMSTLHREEFCRLERRSLEWGATFEPAQNTGAQVTAQPNDQQP